MTTKIKIGPADHGRRMSLAGFEHAEVEEGHLYELGRGVIIVSDVPNPRHFAQVMAIRRQLAAYDLAHPNTIYGIAAGSDCKILVPDLESERHPDLAVYKTPPHADEAGVWATWVPEIVIEVVSADSAHRDFDEKPEEYLNFGVQEYWIVDAKREEVRVLRRSGGRWAERIVRPGKVCKTRLLPGFEFSCAAVFKAARAIGS
jgi:Uma2 family endonuclease